jgi:hypothetical protein
MTDTNNKPDLMATIVYTDTFGGEANYCWVREANVRVQWPYNNSVVIRRCKAALGIKDRHRVEDYGCDLTLRFRNSNTIAFITFTEATNNG